MTSPTHGIFALLICLFFGATGKDIMFYMLLGSLLPDIDHPRSILGRLFFFVSGPINKKFGHRNITHSFVVWFPLLIIGFSSFKPIGWIAFGALTHLFLDMWNYSGLALFNPVSQKIFVMANKRYRIRSGSRNEFILMIIFLLFGVVGYKLDKLGGLRGSIREMMGDYNTVIIDYEKEGTKKCYIEGKLRYNSGIIEKNKWLIIGKNKGYNSLSIYDSEEKIIKIPEDGKFLRSNLRRSENEWNMLNLESPKKVKNNVSLGFYKVNKYWYPIKKGEYVFGDVIYVGRFILE